MLCCAGQAERVFNYEGHYQAMMGFLGGLKCDANMTKARMLMRAPSPNLNTTRGGNCDAHCEPRCMQRGIPHSPKLDGSQTLAIAIPHKWA